jgi:Domain of unknown function (DUF4281)
VALYSTLLHFSGGLKRMLAPIQIFSIANIIAMLCWIALAISLFASGAHLWIQRITGYWAPALFALVYVYCIGKGFAETTGGGFGSIGEVRALFANDSALTAGWLHYLAFDLFVGTWIVRQGTLERLHPLLLLLCLPVTFMLGPIGFLLFLILRAVFSPRSATGEVA